MEDKWLDEVTVDILPEVYQHVVEVVGIRKYIELCKEMGGTNLYLPKLDSVIRPLRDKMIRNEFDGNNYKELAVRFNLSERWVRDIIDPKQVEGQLNLFETLGVK